MGHAAIFQKRKLHIQQTTPVERVATWWYLVCIRPPRNGFSIPQNIDIFLLNHRFPQRNMRFPDLDPFLTYDQLPRRWGGYFPWGEASEFPQCPNGGSSTREACEDWSGGGRGAQNADTMWGCLRSCFSHGLELWSHFWVDAHTWPNRTYTLWRIGDCMSIMCICSLHMFICARYVCRHSHSFVVIPVSLRTV